jgi:BNR repeat-like domain
MHRTFTFVSWFARSLLLGMACLMLVQCTQQTADARPATALPEMSTSDLPNQRPMAGVMVDVSEDEKVLGFSGQRKIVSDSQGRLFVAYRKQFRVARARVHRIHVARSDDQGRTWRVLNEGAPVEAVGDFIQRVPALEVDARDRLHLVWYGTDEQNAGPNQRQIKYSRSDDGGESWSDWRNIAPVEGYAEPQKLWQEHPSVTVVGDTVWVVWQGRDPSSPRRSQIRVVRSLNSGDSWDAPTVIQRTERGDGGRSRPVLLAEPDARRLHVLAYGEADGDHQIVWTVSEDGGASWSSWMRIAPSAADQRHLSAVIDTANRVHVVWREGTSGGPAQIRHSVLDEGRWTVSSSVSPSAGSQQFFPSLTLLGGRELFAVWVETRALSGFPEEDPRNGRVLGASTSGGRWGSARVLTTDTAVTYAAVTRNRNVSRQIDLVWSNMLGDKETRIQYAPVVVR